MDCPKCGVKAEDYAVYCPFCGEFLTTDAAGAPKSALVENTPQTPEKPPKKVAQRLYPPVQEASPPQETATPTDPVSSESPGAPIKKTTPQDSPSNSSGQNHKSAFIILAVVAVLSVFISIYIIANTGSLRVELTKAQTERASAQASVESLSKQVSTLEAELETALAEKKEYASEASTLKSQLNAMESSVSQSSYDKASAERELSEALEEIDALTGEITDLKTQITETEDARDEALAEKEKIQASYDSLEKEHKANQDELGFYDTYVVFVMINSDTKYYHKYDCEDFTKRNFLAYSTKLAEANGYAGCPKCMD